MSLIPAFEVGIKNAWILQVLFFLTLCTPEFFMNRDAKERTKRARSIPPGKTEKMMFLATHTVIMPLAMGYSIFLPLKTGGVWCLAGWPLFMLSLIMTLMTTLEFAATPLDEPVTRGVYRISRNPIYLSGFLLYISIGITCASWIYILFGILWIAFLRIVVSAEERYCLDIYGNAYRKYMDRTPRWIGMPKKD